LIYIYFPDTTLYQTDSWDVWRVYRYLWNLWICGRENPQWVCLRAAKKV